MGVMVRCQHIFGHVVYLVVSLTRFLSTCCVLGVVEGF